MPHLWVLRILLIRNGFSLSHQSCNMKDVVKPGGEGEFKVNLSGGPGPYSVEWLSINTGTTIPGQNVRGGAVTIFSTPFAGPAVLYLKSTSH